MIYAGLLSIVVLAALTMMLSRDIFELDVLRDRNALYRDTADGLVENIYTLKLINKSEQPRQMSISLRGPEGMRLLGAEDAIEVGAGEVLSVPVRVQIDPYRLKRTSTEIAFTMRPLDESAEELVEEARFLGPAEGR